MFFQHFSFFCKKTISFFFTFFTFCMICHIGPAGLRKYLNFSNSFGWPLGISPFFLPTHQSNQIINPNDQPPIQPTTNATSPTNHQCNRTNQPTQPTNQLGFFVRLLFLFGRNRTNRLLLWHRNTTSDNTTWLANHHPHCGKLSKSSGEDEAVHRL